MLIFGDILHMKKRIFSSFLTSFLIFLFSVNLIAQKSINGIVLASDNSDPLVGVTVMVKGTEKGTITDLNGSFSLNLEEEENIIVASFVGYKSKEISVNNITKVSIFLEEDITELGEVVVTALGFKEERDKLGQTASKVEGNEISRSAETGLIDGMAGKASGLRVTRSSGDPGAGSHIQIRGPVTITSSLQPLIILDGVPIDNSSGTSSTSGVVSQSRLNDINPNDIESIQILKGASAAALWGSQAAKGVIYITTKSGEKGSKPKISFKSVYSVDKINARHPLQSTFGQGDNGNYNSFSTRSWGDKISDRDGSEDIVDMFGPYFIDQNGVRHYNVLQKNSKLIYDDSNFNQIIKDGHYTENTLSISGGGENGTNYFSVGDLNQSGIIQGNSKYRRTTLRFNSTREIGDKIKITFKNSYSNTKSDRIRKGASSTGLYLGLLRTPADFDNTGYIGEYYLSSSSSPIAGRHRSYRNPTGGRVNAGFNNPNWTINNQKNNNSVERFLSNIQLDFTLTDWLTIVSRTGIDYYQSRTSQFFKPGTVGSTFGQGYFTDGIRTNRVFNTDIIARSFFDINPDLNMSLILGANLNDRKYLSMGGNIRDFILPIDLYDFSNAQPENVNIEDFDRHMRTAATYLSLNLGIKDMIFINSNIRGEASSTIGPEAESIFIYPSVDIAWQFSKLNLFLGSPILTFGKLRLAYGEVGVEPPPYNTQSIYVSPNYSDSYGGSLSTDLFGAGSFTPSQDLGDPKLSPEIKKEYEIGTDLRFLDNKIKIGYSYYYNKTEDVFFNLSLANSSGYDEIFTNAGEIENKGMEVDFTYDIISINDFTISLNANWSFYRNKVLDLKGVESIRLGGLSAVSGRAVEGYPLGVFWGTKFARNDDGTIFLNSNGFPTLDLESGVIGDPHPDWQGGLGTTLSWKDLSLFFLFERYHGADIYAGTRAVLLNYGRHKDSAVETTAQKDLFDYNGGLITSGTIFRGSVHDFGAGDVALTEPWYRGIGGYFSGVQEQFVEDGSWTRLRELTLSYSLRTPKFIKSTKLSSIDFSFTGRNLFIWTDFIGNDPDTNLTEVSTTRGIDYFNNPGTKSYVFKILINY